MENFNDYRICNYVYIEGRLGPCQIDEKSKDGKYWFIKSVKISNFQFSKEDEDFSATMEELMPIPVYGDDELIKFGFIEDNGSWNKNDFCITKNFVNGSIVIKYIDKDAEITIRFIHELQNLYFDRKGELLVINSALSDL